MVFRAAIVAAVASSAFTVFVFPESLASTPRKVIGGHAVAVISGAIPYAIAYDRAWDLDLTLRVLAIMPLAFAFVALFLRDPSRKPANG